MKNQKNKYTKSRHCGRGPAIQDVNKENTSINKLDPGYPAGRPSGMTARKAFTLIELLVVVLIIGVLTAIALPQYEKVVEKAKATQALILLRHVADAQKAYFLANGTYAQTFSDLGVDISWNGSQKGVDTTEIKDTRSNNEWSWQIFWAGDNDSSTYMTRLNGKYKGGGFVIYNGREGTPSANIRCIERKSTGVVFQGNAGDYCKKVMNGTEVPESLTFRIYILP